MKHTIRSKIMMVLAVVVVLVLVPLVFIYAGKFEKLLSSAGVVLHPNINDGYIIAEFEDPPDDLLRVPPSDTIYKGITKALDIRKFSVKKVKYNFLSGMGIEPRLNLCFEFDGEQPNPFNSTKSFSFPVIHVYIKTPGDSLFVPRSGKSAKVNFDNDGYNYQVIIDGMHEQAMVYDNNGSFITKGLGLYLNNKSEHVDHISENETRKTTKSKIVTTKITAGLPLDIIGDPEKGEWKYYVVVGLFDLRSPSLFYPGTCDSSSDVYDCILPKDHQSISIGTNGKLNLFPLIVKN
jgi:hypothetical protein